MTRYARLVAGPAFLRPLDESFELVRPVFRVWSSDDAGGHETSREHVSDVVMSVMRRAASDEPAELMTTEPDGTEVALVTSWRPPRVNKGNGQ